jgi:hypothetical protein
VTVIGDVTTRNGPVSVFFRKKCNVREKAILHAMQNDKYLPLAALKLSALLNKVPPSAHPLHAMQDAK